MKHDNISALATDDFDLGCAEFRLRIASLMRSRSLKAQDAHPMRKICKPLAHKEFQGDAQDAQTRAIRSPHDAQNATPFTRVAYAAVIDCGKSKPLQSPYQLQLERTTTIGFVAACRASLAQPDGDHSHDE